MHHYDTSRDVNGSGRPIGPSGLTQKSSSLSLHPRLNGSYRAIKCQPEIRSGSGLSCMAHRAMMDGAGVSNNGTFSHHLIKLHTFFCLCSSYSELLPWENQELTDTWSPCSPSLINTCMAISLLV